MRDGKRHLSESDLIDIRARLSCGETQVSIARSYGVHFVTINQIASGRVYRGIGDVVDEGRQ